MCQRQTFIKVSLDHGLDGFKSSSSVEFALHASVASARRSGMSDSDVVFVLTSSVEVLRGHNATATE